MRNETTTLLLLILLAMLFTVALTFASIELPRLADAFLQETIDTPDVATGLNDSSGFKTELYLEHFPLRTIGYVSLAIIIVLIVVGFATERSGWSAAGAIFLFLPVFGHFAATMFFLGGLGFLRLLWLPALDVSFGLFRLGDIINVPYDLLTSLDTSSGLFLGSWISYGITGLGLLIFFLGTLTWFYARIQKRGVADFWVYRFSRHPQYLGWIIWSYGMMYLPGVNIRLCYELSNSLPWLLSTMIIIGVAMLEEVRMTRASGASYYAFRQRTPFLIPLPRLIAQSFTLPLRVMFKKEQPERKREIVAILAFYTFCCLGLSAFYGGIIPLPQRTPGISDQTVGELARVLKEADNFGEKRRAAGELEKLGEPAVESVIGLLDDPVPQVRAYSAGALGGVKSERAIAPLITLLHDDDSYVRKTAAGSLGRIGSPRAMTPLVEAMNDPKQDVVRSAVLALGGIKDKSVIPHLVRALGDTALGATVQAAVALGELGAPEGIEPLIHCFEGMSNCPHDVVGKSLWKLKSDRAVDVWITGLKKELIWYRRAACATELGRLGLEKGIVPLQEAVKDESREVRRAALLALMEFRSDRTIETFRMALEDEDLEVRMYAEEALRILNDLQAK